MPRSSSALEVSRIAASHEARDGERVPIFKDVSFVLERGEILGVFGANGSGKSTLLRALAGLHRLEEGSVVIGDGAVNPTDRLILLPQRYRESFFGWASLMFNIRLTLPKPVRNWRANTRRVRQTSERLGIDVDLQLRRARCSGGMVQQAALVRAFSSEPTILMADEPFSALDFDVASRVRRGFRKEITRLNAAAIVVLHKIEDLVELCDRVLVVPPPPYSTEDLAGFSTAHIMPNSRKQELADAAVGVTFLAMAERMLGADEQ